ncbi:MFS transporter [Erwinia sp. INIA-01]|uniref:MFS transporter n=1 Tax=Erwinia sp. INIA01 TaxID=2991500 RepID=UPI002224BEAD|nr:MFS transporter [Erwinia sp. INIA01]MCW1874242.1 MFS transporter [Erwinia sp. INIA01]
MITKLKIIHNKESLAIQFGHFLSQHPKCEVFLYITAALILGLSQGFSINLFASNIASIQGYVGLTQDDMLLLNSVFYMSNLTAIMLLYKFRAFVGLKLFAELGLVMFLICSVLQLYSHNSIMAFITRFLMGISSAPLNTLAVFYVNEKIKSHRKILIGLTLGMFGSQLAVSFSSIVTNWIIDERYWTGVFVIDIFMALLSLVVIIFIPLTQTVKENMFECRDIVSYISLFIFTSSLSLYLISIVVYFGDDGDSLSFLLVISGLSLALLFANERHRKNPIVVFSWITKPEMFLFFCSLFVFRIIMSETNSIVVPLLMNNGTAGKADFPSIYLAFSAGLVFGTIMALRFISEKNVVAFQYITLWLCLFALISDYLSGDTPAPEEFIMGQFVMGVASALYISGAIYYGYTRALILGKSQFMSFLLIFLGAQSMGTLISNAVITAMHKIFSAEYIALLGDKITPGTVRRSEDLSPQFSADEGIKKLTQLADSLAWHDNMIVLMMLSLFSLVTLFLVRSLCVTYRG